MSVLPLNLIKGTRSVVYERLENTEDIDDVEHQIEKLKSKVGLTKWHKALHVVWHINTYKWSTSHGITSWGKENRSEKTDNYINNSYINKNIGMLVSFSHYFYTTFYNLHWVYNHTFIERCTCIASGWSVPPPYLSAVPLCLSMQLWMVSIVLINQPLKCRQHKQGNTSKDIY